MADGDHVVPDPLVRRLERRVEELEAVQAGLAERLAGVAEAGNTAKLQSVAGALLNLVQDRNAALEAANAGLDQLRTRLKALEVFGDAAEARALFESLRARLGALEAARAREAAQALEGQGASAEIAEQVARLQAQTDAVIEIVFARLGPLEAKVVALEGRGAGPDPEAAPVRFGERLAGGEARLGRVEKPGVMEPAAALVRIKQHSSL